MIFFRTFTVTFSGLLLVSCASTPPVSINYNLAKTTIDFKAQRSIACSDGNRPAIANAVTITSRHYADPKTVETISLAGLDGVFSNTDLGIKLREDGRLAGLNATTTGQGETIIKSGIALAKSFVLNTKVYKTECDYVRKHGGTNKVLTLTFTGSMNLVAGTATKQADDSIDVSVTGNSIVLQPDLTSAQDYNALQRVFGVTTASSVSPIKLPPPPASHNINSNRYLALPLKQPSLADFLVTVSGGASPGSIWKGQGRVAHIGTDYSLPIPKGAAFGKQGFSVELAESGAVTSIKYSKEAGTSKALNSADAIASAFSQPSAADQAAEVKAQGDLIAQTQRLAKCIANPIECT